MKILLTGANGQLGIAIQRTQPAHHELITLTHQQLDISDRIKVTAAVASIKPDWIVNAAAYTAVDAAESQRQLAYAINAEAVTNLANAAKQYDAGVLHLSTDYVFSGTKNIPYLPTDETGPLNIYGKSKLAGEQTLLEILPERSLIIRAGWLYGNAGKNFVKMILKLLQEKSQLDIVADQIGTPTWTHTLAQTIWQFIEFNNVHGIYHCSDAGVASWYDFANAIQEEAISNEIIKNAIPIYPIASKDFPAPAPRPAYSVLDKTDTWALLQKKPLDWRDALQKMLGEFVNA